MVEKEKNELRRQRYKLKEFQKHVQEEAGNKVWDEADEEDDGELI